jgi:hypothetical protein
VCVCVCVCVCSVRGISWLPALAGLGRAQGQVLEAGGRKPGLKSSLGSVRTPEGLLVAGV